MRCSPVICDGERRRCAIERSKYNVDKDRQKRTCDGIVFDSVLEMTFYRDVLCPLVKSGDITRYELQKAYELQPKFTHGGKTVKAVTYVADFYMEFANGKTLVVDTKGKPDSVALLKRKMFWYRYPDTDYRWVCYSKQDGGWCEYDTVKKKRAERKYAARQAEEKKEERSHG